MSWFSHHFAPIRRAVSGAEHVVGSAAHAVAKAAAKVERPAERLAHAALSPVILATEAPVKVATFAIHKALPHAGWAAKLDSTVSSEVGSTVKQAMVVGSIGAGIGMGIATLDPAAIAKAGSSAVGIVAAAAAGGHSPAPASSPVDAPPPTAPVVHHSEIAKVWHYFMTREWES